MIWQQLLEATDEDWRRTARQFALRCRFEGESGRHKFWAWIGDANGVVDIDCLVIALVYWALSEREGMDELADLLQEAEPAWSPDAQQRATARRLAAGHPLFGHTTKFLPDDSIWCEECGGIVAVADG